jgi:hypothetical protein
MGKGTSLITPERRIGTKTICGCIRIIETKNIKKGSKSSLIFKASFKFIILLKAEIFLPRKISDPKNK